MRMIFVLAMDLPVEMKRSNFGVVPFVVGEVKMIRQSLLFSCEPAIVKKKNTKYFQKYLQRDTNRLIGIHSGYLMCTMHISTMEILMCIILTIASFYKPFFDQMLIYYDHLLYIVNCITKL